MEAPLPTIPSVAQRPRPTTEEDGVLMYVQEVVSGAATLLQQVPVVGGVCATFLSLQKLVETARSNEEDLANLCDLCDVVIKGVLDKHSDRSGLYQGFVALEVHVKKAEEVAKRCNGVGRKRSLKRFFLTRKTSDAIAAIRSNILSLTTANTLALTEETLEKVGKLPTEVAEKLETRDQLTVTRYISKWNVVVGCLCVGAAALAAAAATGFTTGNFAGSPGLGRQIYETTRHIDENLSRALEEARERVAASGDAEKDLKVMREEVAFKTKELGERDKEIEKRDRTSLDLEVELRSSREMLAAMETALEEHRRVADLASRAKVPPSAPNIRD